METALLDALAADLGTGFEKLVRTRQHRLFAFAFALTGDSGEAEDAAQEAFVRAYRALEGYPPERIRELKLDGWLHTIALNVVRNQRRRPRLTVLELDEDRDRDPFGGPEAAYEQAETQAKLAAEVSALPPAQRDAVVLRCVQGFKYSEVAELLEQPLGTVKSNVHRALETLRARLESEVVR